MHLRAAELSAAELIRALGLAPHPEGGFFREIFRSPAWVDPQDPRGRRSALTAIYFLLAEGQVSRWHAVSSDEVWHVYEGEPLELSLATPSVDAIDRIRLGSTDRGLRPVHVVPAGWWQTARPLGDYALCGCTVAPGFDFADFRFLSEDRPATGRLRENAPDLVRWL